MALLDSSRQSGSGCLQSGDRPDSGLNVVQRLGGPQQKLSQNVSSGHSSCVHQRNMASERGFGSIEKAVGT